MISVPVHPMTLSRCLRTIPERRNEETLVGVEDADGTVLSWKSCEKFELSVHSRVYLGQKLIMLFCKDLRPVNFGRNSQLGNRWKTSLAFRLRATSFRIAVHRRIRGGVA